MVTFPTELNTKRKAQCAGGIFNLEQKFRWPFNPSNYMRCIKSLNQKKNLSVNRFPSKLGLLQRDFRKADTKSPHFIVKKGILIFWQIQTRFASM